MLLPLIIKFVTSFILMLLLWCSGFSIVTFIAARRKTLTGEECKISFAEKNRGTSKKLTAGDFETLSSSPSFFILRVHFERGVSAYSLQ